MNTYSKNEWLRGRLNAYNNNKYGRWLYLEPLSIQTISWLLFKENSGADGPELDMTHLYNDPPRVYKLQGTRSTVGSQPGHLHDTQKHQFLLFDTKHLPWDIGCWKCNFQP